MYFLLHDHLASSCFNCSSATSPVMEGEGLAPLIPIFATAHDPKPAQSIYQPHNVLSLTILLFLSSHFPYIGLRTYPFFPEPKFDVFKFPSPFVAVITKTTFCNVSTLCIFPTQCTNVFRTTRIRSTDSSLKNSNRSVL